MAGRKKLTPKQKLENDIRTTVWFNEVLSRSGLANANQLSASEHWGEKRVWSDYASCRSAPNSDTLNRVEKLLPKSRETFELGPAQSHLFLAMLYPKDELIEYMDDQSRPFWWISLLLPDGSLKQSTDSNLWELVVQLENILIRHDLDQLLIGRAHQTSELRFLGGCILTLRFAIERDKYHENSYVPQIADLVFDCLIYPPIQEELTNYKIEILIRKWLYFLLLAWKEHSIRGRIFHLVEFPREDDFIKNPKLFIEQMAHGEAKGLNEFNYINSMRLNDSRKVTKRLKASR